MKQDKLAAIKFHKEKISEHKEAIKLLEGSTINYALPRHVAFQFTSNGFVKCQDKDRIGFEHDAHTVYIYKGRLRCERCFKKKFGKTKTVTLNMITDSGQIVEDYE